jgi:hypothetical protein
VRVRKLTANCAAILAGFRRKPAALERILKLLPQLTTAECERLRLELGTTCLSAGEY